MLRIFLLLLVSFGAIAQSKAPLLNATPLDGANVSKSPKDSLLLSAKVKEPKRDVAEISISDYLIISQLRDTIHVDTTLTIDKYYKFNSQRQDDFAYLPLSNSGQAWNPLSLTKWSTSTVPTAGFKTKENQRFLPEDINYYHVPTPLSEVYYKTTQSQGQSTDALITSNIHPKLNFMIAYRGHRSLGKYQHQISGRSQLRLSVRYENPNGRYRLRFKMADQQIEQDENGGLSESSIQNFESGNDEFYDRERLDVLFENASNHFTGKFYLLEQDYLLLKSKDSLSVPRLRIGYRAQSNHQDHEFSQTLAYSGYGPLRNDIDSPYDRLHYRLRQFDAYTIISNPVVGWLNAYARHHTYGFTHRSNTSVPVLEEDAYSVGGNWRKKIGPLQLRAQTEFALSGKRAGSYIKGTVQLPLLPNTNLIAGLHVQKQHPGFMFEYFNGSYSDYHWNTSPKLEQRSTVFAQLKNTTYGTLSVRATSIENHAYYLQSDASTPTVTPMQSSSSINLLQLDWRGGIKWGVFRLDTQLRAQNVSGNTIALPLPEFIGRAAVYYEDHWFNKAMFLHLGVSGRYFSGYNMRTYHPILSEFVVQNHQEMDGFPIVNAFFNAKIRQTRLFFIVEHVNADRSTPNYYASPGYPYRYMLIRFGVVWTFFK